MEVVPKVFLLSSKTTMPVMGMGVCPSPPVESQVTKSAICESIKNGYRHFDTAYMYGTEQPLGEAIKESISLGLIGSREEVFITTKLASTFAKRDKVVEGIKESLKTLNLEYVDMYLIHLPFGLTSFVAEPKDDPTKIYETSTEGVVFYIPREYIHALDIKSVWEGMEECVELGLAKAIGVSNFPPKMLDELLNIAKIPPALNQVEMNPFWKQKKLREYCNEKGIHITAYSPLGANGTLWGDNRILESEVLSDIAKAKEKTIAQIALRWVYEQGVSLLAKSFNKERMKQNLEIFDWSLSEEESNKINQLPERKGNKFASSFGHHDILMSLDAEL